VRTELLHDKSNVHITIVEMPAVNTPQFEWCATTLNQHPKPMGTVFQPEVAARAVVWAAHVRRREVMVGMPSRMAVWGEKFIPGLLDRFLARTAVSGQKLSEPISESRPANLWEPVPGNFAAHGKFNQGAHEHSAWLWLNMNRKWVIAMAGAGAAVVAALAGRQPGNRQ
jgi:hypothetical protein